MPYAVDFSTVSTAGLESSPVAVALAGLRAHEARYFKNKYGHVFTVEPPSDAKTTIDWVHRILREERDIVISSHPLEASAFQIENIRMAFVFYQSGLSINVMYTVDDPKRRAVGFKLSEGMEVPESSPAGRAETVKDCWPVRSWCSIALRSNCDPPQGPRPPVHHHPPRGDAHGLRPSAPGFVGGCVRGARSVPLRVGAALRPPASSGDRADLGMDSRRDQDVSVPRGGWPCHGCGKSVERSSSACSIRCRPGCGGGPRRGTRAGCCGLRDQGGACGGTRGPG